MKPSFIGAFLGTALSLCATTVITGAEANSTLVVIRVRTDQAGNCTYRVATDSAFVNIVHDDDTSLFSGVNSDARTDGTVVNGAYHTMVVGHRKSGVASDGNLYSLALQANTQHWAGVTCGSDIEVVQPFSTKNPPLGVSAVDPPPFNTSGFGNYAWPTINWSDQSKTYIDPMTGLLIKRVTAPTWQQKIEQNVSFNSNIFGGTNWTNKANLANWPGVSGTLATYSAATSDPIFVPIDLSVIPDYAFSAMTISGWGPYDVITDAMLRTYGDGGDAMAANRTITSCISADSGSTCATNSIDAVLPQTTAAAGPTAPASGFPFPMWQSWKSSLPFRGHGFGTVLTTVTTSGTTITNTGTATQQYFACDTWKAGGKVLVNGTEVYTIATSGCVSGEKLTTVETMTTHATAVSFKSLCVGFKIVKKTATGTINLAVGYDVAKSSEFTQPFTGARNQCSPNSVTVSVDANGVSTLPTTRSAYMCVATEANNLQVLFALFPDNGETRLLSIFVSCTGNIQGFGVGSTWDPTVATRLYSSIAPGGHTLLLQADYGGDFRAYVPGTQIYDVSLGSTVQNWNSDSMTYTTRGDPAMGQSVDELALAYGNAYYDSTHYTAITYLGISNGQAAWQISQPYQDNPGFFAFQNLSTLALTAMYDNLSTYPNRFEGLHSSLILAGNVGGSFNILGNRGVGTLAMFGGPYLFAPTAVFKSGSWNADTSLTTGYADACPGGIDARWIALGASGTNCIDVRFRQPCSSNVNSAESTNFPCPWDGTKGMAATVAPGDRMWIGADGNATPCNGGCTSMSGETLRIVTTPTATGTTYEWQAWMLRNSENYGTIGGDYGGAHSHANGWVAAMIPPEGRTNAWNWYTPTSSFPEVYTQAATHADICAGYTPGNFTTAMSANALLAYPTGYGIRYDKTFAAQVNTSAAYNVQPGLLHQTDNSGIGTESYISCRQIIAPSGERRWVLDLYHINPAAGTAQEAYVGVGTITASLVGGTVGVFKITSWPGTHTDPKHSPALAYAGRFLLKDISSASTGNVITDATTYSFCVPYAVNECRTGSAVGEAYASVPNVDMRGVNDGLAISGWYASTSPTVFTASDQAWGVQVDVSRNPYVDDMNWRKLTMGFSGPGRQYQFGNLIPTPDGKWAFMQGYWLDGARNELLEIQLPPFPSYETVNHADLVPYTFFVGAGPSNYARVKYGYLEYGTQSQYFCSSRQEACVTDGSTTPFAYATTDAPSHPTSCASGCRVTAMLSSQALAYAAVEFTNASGSTVTSTQVLAPFIVP